MGFTFRVRPAGALKISEIVRRTEFSDIQFHDDAACPVNDEWPLGRSLIYRDKISIRRLQVEYSPQELSIEVFSCSSDADFELAVRIAASAASLSGGAIEDDQSAGPMSVAEFMELRNKSWIQSEALASFDRFIECMNRSETGGGFRAQFSGVNRMVTVGPHMLDMLQQHTSEMRSEVFYRRIHRLNYLDDLEPDVFLASFITLEVRNKNGELESRLIKMRYPEESRALLSTYADFIIFSRLDDENSSYAPATELLNVLGSDVEWLDETSFIAPALTDEMYGELAAHFRDIEPEFKTISSGNGNAPEAERLGEKNVEKNMESPHEPEPRLPGWESPPVSAPGDVRPSATLFTSIAAFSQDEQRVLMLAPVAVFFLVACVDGTIDKKEKEAFASVLTGDIAHHSMLFQDVIARTVQHFDELVNVIVHMQQELGHGEHYAELLVDCLRVAMEAVKTRCSTAEALHFKNTLKELGEFIANSSRDGWGVFRRRISQDEKAALEALGKLLDRACPA